MSSNLSPFFEGGAIELPKEKAARQGGPTFLNQYNDNSMLDAAEIKRILADRAESAAAYLLPAGKQVANEWKAGDVSGAAGNSLSVHLTGDKAGVWMDFATGEGGDLLDLWKAVRVCDFPTALHEASEWLGMASMPPVRRQQAKPVRVFADPPA